MALKSWSLASVTASTVTDLVAATSGKATVIIGIDICNTDVSSTANVTIYRTNSSNTIKSTLWKEALVPGECIHLDRKIAIALSSTPDKIRVQSDVAAVSFDASGDEDTEA